MPRRKATQAALNDAPATGPRTARRSRTAAVVPFPYKLVLNQWMLSLFNATSLEDLAKYLRNEKLEGLDENNVHHFHHALTSQLFNLTQLSTDLLLAYDQNIVKHTLRLNERRIISGEEPIRWKYFQYLTLLFTEIYLDRYFSNPDELLKAINGQIAKYNEDKPEADQIAPLNEEAAAWPQLNKLAFWSATGSGKTLLMHANILQYQHHLETNNRRRELNRIILLTPNEGLSLQHLREFEAAGIHAELFNKNSGSLFAGRAVEIIDIHKLRDEMGEKTVAVDAFESNNLVLVDEGHRGASAGEDGRWMENRNKLCERGFSFEYSATFRQAVRANQSLTNLYARSILFDYSYRYFYQDGFGKDYHILNLDEETQQSNQHLYLVACLLAFFQQQRLFREREQEFRPFNLEKPLWIFVGSSVTKTLAQRDATDIIEILLFLKKFTIERRKSIDHIESVLNQGLVTASGKNLFAGRFSYLLESGLNADQIFDEVLATLFNAPGGGQLYATNIKGAQGEIALHLGDNDPFGVINVGDDSKLLKLCDERGIQSEEREFAASLFQEIDSKHSTVNLLIGSKKFTEGWNSYRVSTMGLMNVGQSEGAQIIQLFGRGVRLRGYGYSLKRSNKTQLDPGVKRPPHIGILESLSIFGIHANYMAQFREFLKDEGLPENDDQLEFLLPVIKNLGTRKLKMVRLKKVINGVTTEFGNAYRMLGPISTLCKPDPESDPATRRLQRNRLELNWYPKIQAMRSAGMAGAELETEPNQAHLTKQHIAFLDMDQLYFELEQFKAERGWYNLNLTPESIPQLLADQSWYVLLIPEEDLNFKSFEQVRIWQEVASALLKKYTERYFTLRKQEWEMPHLEIQELSEDDPNFLGTDDAASESHYKILIDESRDEIVAKLEELKGLIQAHALKTWSFNGLRALWFDRHLYQPLLHLEGNLVEIAPVPLNKGEWTFVMDIKKFYEAQPDFFGNRELYLLRNLSRGRGVGFFEAGNFYPDFILWLVVDQKQFIAFVDPKGIRNLGKGDEKLQFYKTIKDIEQRLGDADVQLESFIISNTPSATMKLLWGIDKKEMVGQHILFQDEDADSYIQTMFTEMIT